MNSSFVTVSAVCGRVENVLKYMDTRRSGEEIDYVDNELKFRHGVGGPELKLGSTQYAEPYETAHEDHRQAHSEGHCDAKVRGFLGIVVKQCAQDTHSDGAADILDEEMYNKRYAAIAGN